MSKVVVVTSGKGGVGKTTTSAAFAAALAESPKRTLLVLDIDDTLLTSDGFFGSDKWYEWQKTLPASDPGKVPCLFDVISLNYEAEWSDAQLEQLRGALEDLSGLYIKGYRDGIDFALDLFDSKVITHLKGGYACRDRCKFGKEEMCVAPSGLLYPCERLVGEDTRHDVTIGNVFDGPDLAKVMEMGKRKDTPDLECEECKLNHRCMYWCGCVNYATTGDVGVTSGLLCRLEQMSIAAADRSAGILFKEENPMFISKFYCAG